ncbi:MAG: Dihydroorotase [Alphaproteobacteria bacterium MarineAlpha5_Bin5]|nr:MAG: Dihydroorotase [Alphaproteobacteria bacterium MarineAlpha5_Bin5]PPR52286.1 MAG: Dihydroorotase [Alphaproteobacteria bacterium MarineAlpha5_Bin4]|tara:strand:+ start:363 stop:1409 length:1047 start_codon:yes stop_codon:yes gene_type:complete
MNKNIIIKKPDDWHVHFREDAMLEVITKYSARINNRCIAMPNTKTPITNSLQAIDYKKLIEKNSKNENFQALIPCYLTENLDLVDFRNALKNNIFIGAKLYPTNVTTNSSFGVSNIEKIYDVFEILEKENKTLLIHGEKIDKNIDIFDREKYFIDEELTTIRNTFQNLKIVLEHVSTKYGVDYIKSNSNIAGTITPHHMLLTKKDVFLDNIINPHHYCMPVVKNENDLLALRKAACKNNTKFFLGTDSAPHEMKHKFPNMKLKPGIFSAACSIELYAKIFEEENSLDKLETFASINGPKFYNLPINESTIRLEKIDWIVPEFVKEKSIKIKNFFGNKKINWKVVDLNV